MHYGILRLAIDPPIYYCYVTWEKGNANDAFPFFILANALFIRVSRNSRGQKSDGLQVSVNCPLLPVGFSFLVCYQFVTILLPFTTN